MRKVNNFAAAGNEGLGPAEDFQIEWGQVYAVGVICPPKSNKVNVSVKNKWGQIPHCTLDSLLMLRLMKFIYVEIMVISLIFCIRLLNKMIWG